MARTPDIPGDHQPGIRPDDIDPVEPTRFVRPDGPFGPMFGEMFQGGGPSVVSTAPRPPDDAFAAEFGEEFD